MSKIVSMETAIRSNVYCGDVVYMAGFTHLIPCAAGHEIIRQKLTGLTLCRATPDLVYDQMIAAGCARKLVFSYAGNPGVGLLRCFRRAVESAALELEEYSHYGMAARLHAGATKLPFMAIRSLIGTDLVEHNPHLRSVSCPYTGETLRTVPALRPDVGIIHVQQADASGNCRVWGILGEQREVAFASKKVIVTAEEIVDSELLRSDPCRTIIPGFLVHAVVEVPWGAHPSYAQGYYDRDNDAYVEWDRVSQSETRIVEWLDDWVHGVADRTAYVRKLDPSRLAGLKVEPHWSAPVNYGVYHARKDG